MSGIDNELSGRAGFWGRVMPVLLLGFVLALLCAGGVSQQGSGHNSGTPPAVFQPQITAPFDTYDQPVSPEAQRRVNMINTERQKSMVTDADKLLALATELSREIAKSNSGELSPDQIHKVAEIEKLAHNVKDKMVMPIRNPEPNMDNSPFAPFLH